MLSSHKQQLARLAGLFLALLTPAMLLAQPTAIPIAVSPVVVKLATGIEYASVEVSNRGNQATGVEIEVVRVKWEDGKESYEPTTDFVVSPPAFRVQAGKARMVRFRYSAQRQPSEGFYRLFVRQLLESGESGQINMVFNLGVPIFIEPVAASPALQVTAAPGAGDMALVNNGNVTLTLLELQGTDCAAQPQKTLGRLSPDQKLIVKSDVLKCATAVRTDRGPVQLARP